jgi:hypothetical protein
MTITKITAVAGIAAVLALGVGACGSTAHARHAAVKAPVAASSQPPAPATSQPPAAPAPDGTYTGSGDYILGPGTYDNNYLVGEVDLRNTGNVGEKVMVTFSWPQEGYVPITAHKTVMVRFGASKTVRFHVSAGNVANSNVIDLLQGWQDGHNYRDGYKWQAKIIDTFGVVHS